MNSQIIEKLKELKPILEEKFGIKEFAVFGSVAKGLDNEESDVDIVIMKIEMRDAFAIFDARDYLSEVLKRPVDIGIYRSMKTFIKKQIQKDLIYV